PFSRTCWWLWSGGVRGGRERVRRRSHEAVVTHLSGLDGGGRRDGLGRLAGLVRATARPGADPLGHQGPARRLDGPRRGPAPPLPAGGRHAADDPARPGDPLAVAEEVRGGAVPADLRA